MRYLRAFFIAWRLTLGKQDPATANEGLRLRLWMNETQTLVDAVFQAAEKQAMNQTTRENLRLVIEGRERSMQNILATVAYHATQEYPHILKNDGSTHSLTAIYAINLNDLHSLKRLGESETLQNPTLKSALQRLSEHLSRIPAGPAA